METVKVYSPVNDENIKKDINGSPIWVGLRYHEDEVANVQMKHPVLYGYSFKFDGLVVKQFTGVKKLTR